MGGFNPGCGEHQASCEPVWPLAGKILSEGVEDAEDLWSKISKLSEQGSQMKIVGLLWVAPQFSLCFTL